MMCQGWTCSTLIHHVVKVQAPLELAQVQVIVLHSEFVSKLSFNWLWNGHTEDCIPPLVV